MTEVNTASDITKNDIPVNIEDIMHTAYLQYSLSVNIGRAIPDVRDGLKTGNRRILYAMRQLGLTKSHAYTKCAKVVGEVIGNYHPHGDSSVYDALVRMAQDFSMRNPLIDGQGNFGSIDGDPPAAYRYTECRMERITEELLEDIEKDTVNMNPTFDEATMEPEVLPAKFPNLLVNGSTGIGVGMATNIPPHNLGEIIDATIELLNNPAVAITDLMKHIKGPDFPTGATIKGIGEIYRLYNTGHGVIKIRAKAEIKEDTDKEQIIVTELPYSVNKENLVKKIADLVRDKKIVGIAGLRDETSRRAGIRIVIDIKRNAMASIVLNQLYAHTQLELGFPCSLLVVDKNRPKTMNLKQILQAYIDHRLEVVTRRARFDLNKAEARAHILEGLLIAVKNINAVIKVIKESRDKNIAADALVVKFKLTKIQANAILDMRLHQLTGLAIEDLEKEYNDLTKHIEYLKSLLAGRQLRLSVIKDELISVKNKFAEVRRTAIDTFDDDFGIADLIERHACIITVSKTGYIQRVPIDTFKTQHRGGKGVKGMETKEEDIVEHLFVADSHDVIFFFSEKGSMYWLYVYEIPEGIRTGKGKAIVNLIKVEPGEQIKAMLTVKKEDLEKDNLFITMATKNGFIKKTVLSAFKNLRNAGLKSIFIEDGDDLVDVAITDGKYDILMSSASGLACRFKESDVKATGRTSRGVIGMRFKREGDYLVSMLAIKPLSDEEVVENVVEEVKTTAVDNEEVLPVQPDPEILVISTGGIGKRSYITAYSRTRRGARGVINIRLKEGEKVISVLHIEKGDEILISTQRGQTVRIPINEIRTVSRASKGVRIMNLDNNDTIAGVAKVMEIDGNGEAKEKQATEEGQISQQS